MEILRRTEIQRYPQVTVAMTDNLTIVLTVEAAVSGMDARTAAKLSRVLRDYSDASFAAELGTINSKSVEEALDNVMPQTPENTYKVVQ